MFSFLIHIVINKTSLAIPSERKFCSINVCCIMKYLSASEFVICEQILNHSHCANIGSFNFISSRVCILRSFAVIDVSIKVTTSH